MAAVLRWKNKKLVMEFKALADAFEYGKIFIVNIR